MKQLYIPLLFIATLFLLPRQAEGQSFDIVDPGLQVINFAFDLEIINATDGSSNLDGDYAVQVFRTSSPTGTVFHNLVNFINGSASIPLTLGILGNNNLDVIIMESQFSELVRKSTTIVVHNNIWLGGNTGNTGNENDWGTAANWDPSVVPGVDDFIGIPATLYNPQISGSSVTVNNLSLYDGASLTVSSSQKLTVKLGGLLNIKTGAGVTINGLAELATIGSVEIESGGILTIGASGSWTAEGTVTNDAGNAGISIESDQNGTGSVILESNLSIGAVVKRYVSGGGWHLISTPVSGQVIKNFITNTNNDIPHNTIDGNFAMTLYEEDQGSESGGWGAFFTTSTSGNMGLARGYLTGRRGLGTFIFSGILNKGDINDGLITRSITSGANGWNAIGNPFPSAIGVTTGASSPENFLGKNSSQLDPSFAGLYIYDPSTNGYKIINNTNGDISQDYIQSGQGFLVKAKSGGGTAAFSDSMRMHRVTETFYKKSQDIPWPIIRLKVTSDDSRATTVITFNSNMTRGLDPTYDAGQFGADPAFRVFTRLIEGDSDVNFAIQALPDYGFEDMEIPVGFDFTEGGEITFSVEELSLPSGAYAILEDRAIGIFTDLETEDYTVTVDADTKGPGRFYLHADIQTTSVDDPFEISDAVLNIYSHGKEIFMVGEVTGDTWAGLYDLMGREIMTIRLQQTERNSFRVDEIDSGIYLLRIYGGNNQKAKRLFIE